MKSSAALCVDVVGAGAVNNNMGNIIIEFLNSTYFGTYLLWFCSQMSPKDPYAKGLIVNLWCYWEMVEVLVGGV
jgi:hypothetical protein